MKSHTLLEKAAYICVIGLCLVASTAIIKNNFFTRSQPRIARSSGLKGKSLPNVWAWTGATSNVVLAIDSTCAFCRQSVGFYQTLGREREGRQGRLAVIVLTNQKVAEMSHFLEINGVAVDGVRQVALGSFGVVGTPTVLLADADGKVTQVFEGLLDTEQQSKVLATLPKHLGS